MSDMKLKRPRKRLRYEDAETSGTDVIISHAIAVETVEMSYRRCWCVIKQRRSPEIKRGCVVFDEAAA